jgi:hypothetical protein
MDVGEYEAAEAAMLDSLAHCRSEGEPGALATALGNLSELALSRGHHPLAAAWAEQAVAAAAEAGSTDTSLWSAKRGQALDLEHAISVALG